ncbi:MAG: O-antigen ligase family protein [Bacilli bacterium]|nr:O-antigen ligase family protein [Bacilli bacterium]
MRKVKTNRYPYQVITVDFLFFFFTFVFYLFITRWAFIYTDINLTDRNLLFFIPVFIFAIGIVFPLIIEQKHNQLKWPKILLVIGIIIAVNNLIATAIVPSEIFFSSVEGYTPYMPSSGMRVYSVLCGIVIGFMPYLFFYLLPRRIRHKKYINYVLYAFLIVLGGCVIASFFTDGQNYINIILHGLTSEGVTPVSGITQKNAFGMHLMLGLFAIILLDIFTHHWQWLLLAIPTLLIQLCTLAKFSILASWIILIIYLCYKLYKIASVNRDNAIIASLLVALVVIGLSVAIVLTINSQSGILFAIKTFFVKSFDNAKTTWYWRTIIWNSLLSAMAPIQFVFGCSYAFTSIYIHESYFYNPLREETNHIWHAHNSYLQNIAEGGVIYLLINILLFGYLIYLAFKMRHRHQAFSFMMIVFIVIRLLYSLIDNDALFSDTTGYLENFVMILPVMAIYYMEDEPNEAKLRQQILVNMNEMKKTRPTTWYTKLEKKLYIHSAKIIAEEKQNEHK